MHNDYIMAIPGGVDIDDQYTDIDTGFRYILEVVCMKRDIAYPTFVSVEMLSDDMYVWTVRWRTGNTQPTMYQMDVDVDFSVARTEYIRGAIDQNIEDLNDRGFASRVGPYEGRDRKT